MIINDGKKDLEVKFTFNSFLYMEDFDLSELAQLETKPIKVISITRKLLMGGLNFDPKNKFSLTSTNKLCEYICEEQNISEVFAELLDELKKSNFFKQLQSTKK